MHSPCKTACLEERDRFAHLQNIAHDKKYQMKFWPEMEQTHEDGGG